ncbi:MAG: bifunctional 5,10-methylenetetrahydrofolate dehydrogenase/5,10-methenyltetrahydrofolate cyclohydrolase [Planctomycetota bacterium]|jgi:methylenetetrahydrofolate dehydrogenase (NADP+)/methenyltetrahydrofolate cyclohydrolase
MPAELLHGKPIADRLKAEAAWEVDSLWKKGVLPRVAAIHNAGSPACRVYMRMQRGLCKRFGIEYTTREFDDSATEREIVDMIEGFNRDPRITGITVHLPPPARVEAGRLLQAVSPDKDIEGTHPHNLGMLAYEDRDPCPCAARAAVEILRSVEPNFKGLEAVIIGHSEMVGKSISYLLLQSAMESATPTICHIATRDLKEHTKRADVLFVAAGKRGLVRGDMIKPGATVIDVGINEEPDGSIVGDVVFDEVVKVAGRITPVPGGVGPVAIAVLLRNILVCANRMA